MVSIVMQATIGAYLISQNRSTQGRSTGTKGSALISTGRKSAQGVVMKLWCIALLTMLFSGSVWSQQNPSVKGGAGMYNLGFGSAPVTCFDGSRDTKNGCVSKWIASNFRVSNSGVTPVCQGTATTACVNYFTSVPYLMALYWMRDGVGASYEDALLHFTQDTGFRITTGLVGLSQFDWPNQRQGLTEGIHYYVPNEAVDGVLLQSGSTYTDITQWAWGGAVTSVAYSGGVFTVTGIATESFSNIGVGKQITLTGFTTATALNGVTATVTSASGSPYVPTVSFTLPCTANCTGSNETGYIASAQAIPVGGSLLVGYMEPFDRAALRSFDAGGLPFACSSISGGVPASGICTVSVSSAQILTMRASPITLIPAQGANNIISVTKLDAEFVCNSCESYGTGPSDIEFYLGTFDTGSSFEAGGLIGLPGGGISHWIKIGRAHV